MCSKVVSSASVVTAFVSGSAMMIEVAGGQLKSSNLLHIRMTEPQIQKEGMAVYIKKQISITGTNQSDKLRIGLSYLDGPASGYVAGNFERS